MTATRPSESAPEEVRIERSRSEAAAETTPSSISIRRPRARQTRRAAAEEPAMKIDARADDFIQRFRKHFWLKRLDSILRYRETLSSSSSQPPVSR